jgi:hypothetical protein
MRYKLAINPEFFKKLLCLPKRLELTKVELSSDIEYVYITVKDEHDVPILVPCNYLHETSGEDLPIKYVKWLWPRGFECD